MCECLFPCNNYPECAEFWQKGFDPDYDNDNDRQTGILIDMEDLQKSGINNIEEKAVSASSGWHNPIK